MKSKSEWGRLVFAAVLALSWAAAGSARAENALFIGNSYTYGGSDLYVSKNGGVPKLVEHIAAAKGKTLSTRMLTVGGKDWTYHLGQPKTDSDLRLKPWDWVVLQDFSTKATHLGNPEEFQRAGVEFYRRVRVEAPTAKVVLYETWARGKGNALYAGGSSPRSFVDAVQMSVEVQRNYEALERQLEALEPGEQARLAPVGLAFARCQAAYPELNLYQDDAHHANAQGSYLAALVIYATISGDTPLGAPREFFGCALSPETAERLQRVAAGAVTALDRE